MSFELKSSPATLQLMMDVILSTVEWQYTPLLLDNVFIFSKTSRDHINQTRSAVFLLKDAVSTLKLSDCAFLPTEQIIQTARTSLESSKRRITLQMQLVSYNYEPSWPSSDPSSDSITYSSDLCQNPWKSSHYLWFRAWGKLMTSVEMKKKLKENHLEYSSSNMLFPISLIVALAAVPS